MRIKAVHMIFKEKKQEKGYGYDVEDVFGEIHIESDTQLDGDTLDALVMLLLKGKASAATVTGEVKHEKGVVKYTFKKADQWSEDDEEEPCENTPTSTKKQGREYTQILLSRIPGLNWLKRFAGAFREAWRSVNNK